MMAMSEIIAVQDELRSRASVVLLKESKVLIIFSTLCDVNMHVNGLTDVV
jgi:3-polyprenyl-4-hydroxybenzoate decarboxylase